MHARSKRLTRYLDDALRQHDFAHDIVVGERAMRNDRHAVGHDDAFPIA